MEQKTGRQMSESMLIGSFLAIAGGYLDAYTYLARGKVFANAQTGNIVLLGLSLAQGEVLRSLAYLAPVFAFAVGVIVTELIRARYREHPKVHWRQRVLAVEIIVIFAVGFFPKGSWDMAANILISFLCAMQVEAFRKINGTAYATTMCTGNLRSGTEHFLRYVQTKNSPDLKKCLEYFGIILFFIFGAAIGTILTNLCSIYAVFLCCLPYGIAFLLMRFPNRGNWV